MCHIKTSLKFVISSVEVKGLDYNECLRPDHLRRKDIFH